jgi:hypothetical protein
MREVYALICEAHSDDDRLLGIYSTQEAAQYAYDTWEDSGLFPFFRIERREIGAAAQEHDPSFVVYER